MSVDADGAVAGGSEAVRAGRAHVTVPLAGRIAWAVGYAPDRDGGGSYWARYGDGGVRADTPGRALRLAKKDYKRRQKGWWPLIGRDRWERVVAWFRGGGEMGSHK